MRTITTVLCFFAFTVGAIQAEAKPTYVRDAAIGFVQGQASSISPTEDERDDHYKVNRCKTRETTASCRGRWWSATTKCSALIQMRIDSEGDGEADLIIWADKQRCGPRTS